MSENFLNITNDDINILAYRYVQCTTLCFKNAGRCICVYIYYNFRSNEQFSGPYGPYGDGMYLFRFQRPSSVSMLCYKSSTVLSKAFILMVMIYYNKRMQIKISNREQCVRPGLEDTRQKLPLVSMKSMDFVSCSQQWFVRTHLVCVLSCFSCVRLFATLWTVAHQTPLSMGFARQEYWSGLCPPPGDLPDLGIEPASLTSPSLAGRFFGSLPLAPPGKPNNTSPVLLISV